MQLLSRHSSFISILSQIINCVLRDFHMRNTSMIITPKEHYFRIKVIYAELLTTRFIRAGPQNLFHFDYVVAKEAQELLRLL